MKKIIMFTLLSFIALAISNDLHAYTWPIKNGTNKTLLVQVELYTSSKPFFALAKPGQTVEFSWPFGNALAGFWMNAIKYVIVDDYLLQNADFLSADKSATIDNNKALEWLTNDAHKKYLPKQAHIDFTFWKNGKPVIVNSREVHCAANDDRIAADQSFTLIEKENGDIVANTKTISGRSCKK